jgi:hypothetical protein
LPADLSTSNPFRPMSFIIDEDCLTVLKHEPTRDRIHRILFDRVESVTIWRTWPWVHMLVVGALFGLPGLLLILTQNVVGYVWSGILLFWTATLLARYAIWRKTHFRIVRAGKVGTFATIRRPSKVRRFITRLQAQIVIAQDRAAQAAATATVPPSPIFAPQPTPPPMTPESAPAPTPPASLNQLPRDQPIN